MSDTVKRALMRFVRIAVFGGLASLLGFWIGEPTSLKDLGLTDFMIPLAIAIIAFADKWVRDQLSAAQGG